MTISLITLQPDRFKGQEFQILKSYGFSSNVPKPMFWVIATEELGQKMPIFLRFSTDFGSKMLLKTRNEHNREWELYLPKENPFPHPQTCLLVLVPSEWPRKVRNSYYFLFLVLKKSGSSAAALSRTLSLWVATIRVFKFPYRNLILFCICYYYILDQVRYAYYFGFACSPYLIATHSSFSISQDRSQ